jgi:hypothetical protein
MTWSVEPEPTDEAELQVLIAAVEQAVAEAVGDSAAYATPWWRAGLDDLRRGPVAEQPGSEPRVVEARYPGHHEGDDERPPRNRLV